MKILKFIFLALFLISQNALAVSSAFAVGIVNGTASLTVAKDFSCSSQCATNIGEGSAGNLALTFVPPSEYPTKNIKAVSNKVFILPPSYTGSEGDGESLCVQDCENFKDALGFNLNSYNVKSDVERNQFTKAACKALEVATGTAGKTFASFAVIAIGVGFFTGKVSWGLMIGVAAGIATMFGSPAIVSAISGADFTTTCQSQY